MLIYSGKPYTYLFGGAVAFFIIFMTAVSMKLGFGRPKVESKNSLTEVSGKVIDVLRVYNASKSGGSFHNLIEIRNEQNLLRLSNWFEFPELSKLHKGDEIVVWVGENKSQDKAWFWQVKRGEEMILPYEITAQLLQEKVDGDQFAAKISFLLSIVPAGFFLYGLFCIRKST